MGKNKVIEALSRLIANTIVHHILTSKTSKPESINHLESESIEYRPQALKKSRAYHWNNEDIELLKEEINKKIENKFKNKYSDIKVSKEEIKKIIEEEIESLFKANKQ